MPSTSSPLVRMAPLLLLLIFVAIANAQDDGCQVNQIFNGKVCVCAPGYFDKNSKDRCEAECGEEHFSYFTYGTCASGLFNKIQDKEKTSPCSMKCGVRVYLWATIAIFVVIAAALITIVLLLPVCITTCASCLHSKKASKHSKRVVMEQQAQPNKDQQQQLATLSYNPYVGGQSAYWPYYGR